MDYDVDDIYNGPDSHEGRHPVMVCAEPVSWGVEFAQGRSFYRQGKNKNFVLKYAEEKNWQGARLESLLEGYEWQQRREVK